MLALTLVTGYALPANVRTGGFFGGAAITASAAPEEIPEYNFDCDIVSGITDFTMNTANFSLHCDSYNNTEGYSIPNGISISSTKGMIIQKIEMRISYHQEEASKTQASVGTVTVPENPSVGSYITISDINATSVNITAPGANTTWYSSNEFKIYYAIPEHAPYNVTLSGGANAAVTAGNASQTGVTRRIEPTTITADDGYYFADFEDIVQDGVTVKKVDNYTVSVSGLPTADTELTVPDAIVKTFETYTLELTDSWGDGWNGAAIKIYDLVTEELVGSYTISSGETNTATVDLPLSGYYSFKWVRGRCSDECSFVIKDSHGETVCQKTRSECSALTNGEEFFVVYAVHDPYDVTVTCGANATPTDNTAQTDVTTFMEPVTITAAPGYCFAAFDAFKQDGITVKRSGFNTVTVSGVPTADTTVIVPDAVRKDTTGLADYYEAFSEEDVSIYANFPLDIGTDEEQIASVEGEKVLLLPESTIFLVCAEDYTFAFMDAQGEPIDVTLTDVSQYAAELGNPALRIYQTNLTAFMEDSGTFYINGLTPADQVMAKIDAFPETEDITAADKDAVDAARAAYEALSDAQKAVVYVDKLEKLTAAEKAVADHIAADAVIAEIEKFSDISITSATKERVEGVRAAYDALTDDQKSLVSAETLAKLTAAEKAVADHIAADPVIAAISAIGTVALTDESKAAMDAAREAYDDLTDDQKALVANAAVLDYAEILYGALEDKADAEAAQAAAEAAQAQAEADKAAAEEAQADAEAAQAAAEAAQKVAEDALAKGEADAAEKVAAAEAAQKAAEDAQAKAEEEAAAAKTSQEEAETAQKAAEDALAKTESDAAAKIAAAQAAQKAAEDAQAAAEKSAQDAAEKAAAAEAAQKAAEDALAKGEADAAEKVAAAEAAQKAAEDALAKAESDAAAKIAAAQAAQKAAEEAQAAAEKSAKDAADKAAAAETAKKAAEDALAKGEADAAEKVAAAEAAQKAAEDAQAKAEAEAAQKAAEDALAKTESDAAAKIAAAQAAQKAAEDAQAAAEKSAQDAAEKAAAAETAQKAAEDALAKGEADAAEKVAAAEAAQKAAEEAQTKAEEEAAAAKTAQAEAEAAQKAAEEAQAAAEKSAQEAADKAAAAETAKKAAEDALAKGEADAAEKVAAAEAAQKAAEDAQAQADADKAVAEQAAQDAADAQEEAEAAAKQAEADKLAAETAKAEAEKQAAEAKAAADQAAADKVIKKIDAIGEVKNNNSCENAILSARSAYDTLTDAQQALVTNYNVLTAAESEYETISKYYAPVERLCEMAIKDYEVQNGTTPANAEAEKNADGTLSIQLTDENGKVLDTYTIDPVTATGIDTDKTNVNLPQTGVTSKSTAAAVGGAFAMIAAGLSHHRGQKPVSQNGT